jgi:hypothetical protein
MWLAPTSATTAVEPTTSPISVPASSASVFLKACLSAAQMRWLPWQLRQLGAPGAPLQQHWLAAAVSGTRPSELSAVGEALPPLSSQPLPLPCWQHSASASCRLTCSREAQWLAVSLPPWPSKTAK